MKMGEHRQDELGGNFVTGLHASARHRRRGGAAQAAASSMSQSALAGAMRHDLIVRALVLLPATVQTLGLST
jgi:hypothetical protein